MMRQRMIRLWTSVRHGTFAITLVLIGFPIQHENVKIVREKTEARLREIVASARGAMGLVAVDLMSGERLAINENLAFPQGSAIKIPILMEVYKQAHEGRFRLTDRRRIEKAQMVGGSGILKEFGDGMSELSIYDLCVLMIVLSDNTATNMLIDLVGMENVNRTMASLGLVRTRLQRKMIDPAASARGEENLSTPAEAARLMEILYRGEFVSREVCEQILAILKKPKRTAVSSGLPSEVPVASKPGGIPGVSTEWAIVYLKERPYVLVIMENYGMGDEASTAFRDISRTVYEYFWRLGRATRYGTYVDPALLKREGQKD
ncbi:MAG: class A beta-lactamase-related serine hydrolase [Blastocatellia bacterium]|nr:class A beta-lactamase-related serine hydrolase [Blastocatellia bacterium]MCX7752522.1 class A beta-lactamase-related serine hydrolase [Blastocatellia bacterium]MDW8167363.1 serine hydrolase [Acidobacteriota bacterium]